MSENILTRKPVEVWQCKIGGRGVSLPEGADSPMREAIERAYCEITGGKPDFLFSGWGADLDPIESVVAYPPSTLQK